MSSKIWYKLVNEDGTPFLTDRVDGIKCSQDTDVSDFCELVKEKCRNDLALVDARRLMPYATRAHFDAETPLALSIQAGTLSTSEGNPLIIAVPETRLLPQVIQQLVPLSDEQNRRIAFLMHKRVECLNEWKNDVFNLEKLRQSPVPLIMRREVETMMKKLNNGANFLSLFGRWRIGKTFMVKQFLSRLDEMSRKFIFFTVSGSEADIIASFNRLLQNYGNLLTDLRVDSLATMAIVIAWFYFNGIVVVIDEFQYLPRNVLQATLKEKLESPPSWFDKPNAGKIIVFGSHSHLLLDQFTSYQEPLYAFSNDTITLLPFSPVESLKQLMPDFPLRDRVAFYTFFDGVIGYLALFFSKHLYCPLYDAEETLDKNELTKLVGFLEYLMKGEEEFRYLFPAKLIPVLKEILLNTRVMNLKEIQDFLRGKNINVPEGSSVGQIMNNLVEYGFYTKATWENSSVVKYCSAERAFLTFRNVSDSDSFAGEEGRAFEQICRSAVSHILGSNWVVQPGFFISYVEIDVVAVAKSERKVLLGSCKRSPAAHNWKKFFAHIVYLALLEFSEGKGPDWTFEIVEFSCTSKDVNDLSVSAETFHLDATKITQVISDTFGNEQKIFGPIRKTIGSLKGLNVVNGTTIRHFNLPKLWSAIYEGAKIFEFQTASSD